MAGLQPTLRLLRASTNFPSLQAGGCSYFNLNLLEKDIVSETFFFRKAITMYNFNWVDLSVNYKL